MATPKTYVVEVYRPPFPEKGVKYRVHNGSTFTVDRLSPNCSAAFRAQLCSNRDEAIALVMEYAAGKRVQVQPICESTKTKVVQLPLKLDINLVDGCVDSTILRDVRGFLVDHTSNVSNVLLGETF